MLAPGCRQAETQCRQTRFTPDLGGELGTPIRNNIKRNAMEVEHAVNPEISHLQSRRKLGERDEVNHSEI